MTNDLHDAIRDALAIHEIQPADLQQPRLRVEGEKRGSRRWAAAALAAAVVIGVGGLGAIVARHRSDGHEAPSGHPLAGVAGYNWRVTKVADSHGHVTVVASWGAASVGFTKDGAVSADDTVNDLSGQYQVTADGYSVTRVATTQVGYSGADAGRTRTIGAIDDLFGLDKNGQGTSRRPTRVVVRLQDGVLTLRRGEVVVSATRAGGQPDAASAQFRYLGPVSHTTTAASGSLLLTPPHVRARLDPAEAFRRWCASNHCSQRTGRADMVLALLTTPHSGPARPDGTLIRPSVRNVLSYVLTWPNVPCPNYGGPARPHGTKPQPTRAESCTETDPVNAGTGKAIAGQYFDS